MYGELALATKYILLTHKHIPGTSYSNIAPATCLLTAQVGAHGTGAAIPPVDEQVVAMKLVTPNLGTIELSHKQNPWLFRMAKVKQQKVPDRTAIHRQLSIYIYYR